MILGKKWHFDTEAVRSFYMGNVYPAIICAIVAVGSIFGIELYLACVHVLLILGAFAISKSIRPILISLLTFVMQISVKHSPAYPNYSDYYYTGWRLPISVAICVLVGLGFVFFIVKNRIYKKLSFSETPLFIPLILLSSAFLMNGIFSGKWVLGNLVFGFANLVVFALLFILIYHGTEGESSASLAKYFAYISVFIALILISELAALYITSDEIIVDGAIIKDKVALGWGIWNLVGVSLSVLIPVLFYGVHNNKYPWVYFSIATLTYIFAALTLSRNALVFSTLAYVACVIISCFKGKNKRAFRIITLVGIACVILLVILLYPKLKTVLSDYFNRGFSDNGRYALWRAAFDNFLDAPIFGNGFFGFEVSEDLLFSYGLLGKQAHNTPLQLLSAMGLFGFFAYFYYRYETIKPILKKPSSENIYMSMSIAVLLLGSLLDNFIFNIYPMFAYTVALVIIQKSARE